MARQSRTGGRLSRFAAASVSYAWCCAFCPATQAAGTAVAALEFKAQGVQIYTCARGADRIAWKLIGPDAVLADMSGAPAGHHFAGPSWQAIDGSTVVGRPVASSPAPVPGAVPWLVLQAVSHTGTGLFASVTYIVRSDTQGGVAPPTGCDQAHLEARTQVPYSAEYVLFPAGK